VETFGNTVFESLGCGTLPIQSRVATYRDLLPDEHAHRVDYGDIDAAVDLAHQILTEKRRTSPQTLAYLQSEFSLEKMVTSYADVILNAQKKPQLPYSIPQLIDETCYRLSPWCYLSERSGIYHDFRAEYREDNQLIELVQAHPNGFRGGSVASDVLHHWVDEGYVVPIIAGQS